MPKGTVYALSNPAMDGYVKIGKTSNLEQRLKSLDNTSTPLPFRCVFAVEVEEWTQQPLWFLAANICYPNKASKFQIAKSVRTPIADIR